MNFLCLEKQKLLFEFYSKRLAIKIKITRNIDFVKTRFGLKLVSMLSSTMLVVARDMLTTLQMLINKTKMLSSRKELRNALLFT